MGFFNNTFGVNVILLVHTHTHARTHAHTHTHTQPFNGLWPFLVNSIINILPENHFKTVFSGYVLRGSLLQLLLEHCNF